MSEIDLSDPTTLHSIYLVLANKMLSMEEILSIWPGMTLDDAVDWVRGSTRLA